MLFNRGKVVADSAQNPASSRNKLAIIHGGNHGNLQLFVPNEIATTKEELKTWVSANPIVVDYILRNPEEPTPIDLPDIPQNKDVTISIGTQMKPSNIEIEYYK